MVNTETRNDHSIWYLRFYM